MINIIYRNIILIHREFPAQLCGRPGLMSSFIVIFVYFLRVNDIMAKYSNLSSVLNIFLGVSLRKTGLF